MNLLAFSLYLVGVGIVSGFHTRHSRNRRGINALFIKLWPLCVTILKKLLINEYVQVWHHTHFLNISISSQNWSNFIISQSAGVLKGGSHLQPYSLG